MRIAWLLVLLPVSLAAQGNVSTQGFGFPTGQLSARAEGGAGAFGEFDAQSPINPAAIASDRTTQLHFQYDPEFRTVDVGNSHEGSTTSRFPLAMISGPIWGHGAIALSWSTLLDRTFQVSQSSLINNYTENTRDTLTSTIQSSGGINDIRLTTAWAFGSWLAIGGGLDLFTGENRLLQEVTVTDTIPNQYQQSQFKNTLSYEGIGASGGITVRPVKWLGVAGSFRYGGGITVREGDSSSVAHGLIPGRWGAALLLNPLQGLLIAARYDWEEWSRLTTLGHGDLQAQNGGGWSIGADVEGPKLGNQRYITLRLGGGNRPLPYVLAGTPIRETDLSGGVGIPLLAQRSVLDVSITHAARTPVLGINESAYILSVGLTIRP
ncbi:MAG TPA: hypothetical protein VFA43_05335 [Gemmatimonadaceae bacterium]|nr:hypothetical protein [Gemmatimonadaceae bacterium]